MPDALSRSDLMGATREMLGRLSPDMRDLLRELLLHKSIFVGESFVALAARDDAEEARMFRRVFDETVTQGVDAGKVLAEWDSLAHDADRLDQLAKDVRRNLIHALIVIKEISTEAFLATAMVAPTMQLRDELIRLADIDRKHADELRAIVGASTVAEKLRAHSQYGGEGSSGAHAGRYLPGTLGRSIERTLEDLKARSIQPARLVVSPEALRHLRDEGRLNGNVAFELPIDVEMGWSGEAFSIATRERVSLAEILTSQVTDERA